MTNNRQNAWWMKKALACCAAALVIASAAHVRAQQVLLEAEQFADTGGWDVDQQFMDEMGSPFLLAHGLGVPVRDAVTTAKFAAPGSYHVWVRTRDWVAPWNAAGAPGRFQVLVNGLTVALVQDRPVLGGNGSSEVRVWPEGHTRQQPFTHIGDIVEEICPRKSAGSGNAKGAAVYDDDRK